MATEVRSNWVTENNFEVYVCKQIQWRALFQMYNYLDALNIWNFQKA